MGSFSADISRDMFDERLRYYRNILQQAVPIVDADVNSQTDALFAYMRRIQQIMGDGVVATDDWKVVGEGGTNDFKIMGGDSTAEGASWIYLSGLLGILDRNVTYIAAPAAGISGEAQRSIFPKITGISFGGGSTVITDSSANYITDELVGRLLTADVTEGSTFTITANTATTITVTGDATSVAGIFSRYRVGLSTPSGANRTDHIWLHVWFDEVDATEDTDLEHVFEVTAEAQRRWKLEQNIFVREGDATNFDNYTDLDGNVHYTVKLATLSRIDGDATITAGMVNDLRTQITLGGGGGGSGRGEETFVYQGGVPASLVDEAVFDFTSVTDAVRKEYAIQLVGMTVQASDAITAGDITATPVIGGTKVTASSTLDTTVDSGNQSNGSVSGTDANYNVPAQGNFGVVISSDAGLLPLTLSLKVTLYYEDQ